MKTKILIIVSLSLVFYSSAPSALASYRFSTFKALPPIHVLGAPSVTPKGLSPSAIKSIYNIPATGGHGTIAIITAYKNKTIEADLAAFNASFALPPCTISNACFKKHSIGSPKTSDFGWSLETALDVEWAHAIAPTAKILLVEAESPSGTNLLRAVDYAKSIPDVVAISMSWGGSEFQDETTLDNHFTSNHGISFFAASGDSGAGVSWPAVSPNVIAVGGTSLAGATESAWNGSGGGISHFEQQPLYQKTYNISKALNMRAIPDVSYNADPKSGYAVFRSTTGTKGKWYVIGGTSAGTPQWAAIHALGLSASNTNFYKDKSSENSSTFFRDIVSGNNGDCAYYCQARARYDYVTGLGSPMTIHF